MSNNSDFQVRYQNVSSFRNVMKKEKISKTVIYHIQK